MSESKDERETSSPSLKEEREPRSQIIRAPPPPPPPLFLPTATSASSFSSFDFETVTCSTSSSTIKRPRYNTATTSSSVHHHQWKQPQQQSPMGLQNPESSPSPSNPQAQLTSPDSSSSPSLSPIPSSSTQEKQQEQEQHHHHQLRKGKFVSPVWKPHEMLCLAKAWRAQYQGESPGLGFGYEGGVGGGRGKTRAEKDKEVAEYLKKQGVNRDAKTAGTKWDNMLGEFRKVYEWERGSEREQVGKSYFRLSPYERKIHRLPASFDEEVFEELSQFMGPKMRHSSLTNISPSSTCNFHPLQTSRPLLPTSTDLVNLKPLPPPHSFRDDNYPLASMFSERARQMQSYMIQNPRSNPLVGLDPNSTSNVGGVSALPTTSGSSPRVELRRIGRVRMTWEEWVSLWAEEGEYHRGRVKLQGSNLLNADELIYFDDSMVASSLEAYDHGPLKGFSVDRFVSGQQLKVFGRRKLSFPSATTQTSSDFSERIPFAIAAEPSLRWEYQDPTEYFLGCLRAPSTTPPTLFELSWFVQEPPPEELRLPLRKDLYRDLPHGRELFFTTSSTEPLDCKSFTIDILSSLIRSIPSITASTSSSRESYISLWDDCINRVISKFCPFDITFTRKQPNYKPSSSSSESLQDQWPNIIGMVKNFCLWRGEETDQLRESQPLIDPSSTLTQKISWTYTDLPYVLGYYAIGHNVTFCALSPSQPPPPPSSHDHHIQITRTDLYSLDLSNPSERVRLLVPCWRIGMLLGTLVEQCAKNNSSCKSDYQREDLGDGNIIEMTPNTTTKYYPNKRRWQTTKEIHSVLDQRAVPHAEHMMSYNEEELAIVFKPRGVKRKPKNMEELVLALKQVAKALVALHDLSFMHRDLSWDKVLLMMEDEEWFVAGFEEAVGAPQINPSATETTAVEKKAPEIGRGGVHGVKVDVWGIGYLIKTSEVKKQGIVGKQVNELEERCMEQSPEQRPTAADCYHHLLQIQSSLSSAASTL